MTWHSQIKFGYILIRKTAGDPAINLELTPAGLGMMGIFLMMTRLIIAGMEFGM